MSSQEGSGGFFAGFIFGALVGAAVALLFAPAPGEEIREQLREKGIELKDRAATLGAEASKKADEFRLRLQEAVEEGRQAAARKKEELLAQFEKPSQGGVELTDKNA